MTARDLLTALQPYGPRVEDGGLEFADDVPEHLDQYVFLLNTGLRAQLTDRKWYGCGSDIKHAAPVELNPCAVIPQGITLLAIEGGPRWHRIHPWVPCDHPELFAPPAGKRKAAA